MRMGQGVKTGWLRAQGQFSSFMLTSTEHELLMLISIKIAGNSALLGSDTLIMLFSCS